MYECGLECVCKCQRESQRGDTRGDVEGHRVQTVVALVRTQKPTEGAVTCPSRPRHPASSPQVAQGTTARGGLRALSPFGPEQVSTEAMCALAAVSDPALPARRRSSSSLGLFVNLPRY